MPCCRTAQDEQDQIVKFEFESAGRIKLNAKRCLRSRSEKTAEGEIKYEVCEGKWEKCSSGTIIVREKG